MYLLGHTTVAHLINYSVMSTQLLYVLEKQKLHVTRFIEINKYMFASWWRSGPEPSVCLRNVCLKLVLSPVMAVLHSLTK